MYLLQNLKCTRGHGSDAFQVTLPSLKLDPGSTLAITGSSGCGKSTLLEMLGLVMRPSSCDLFLWQHKDDNVDIELLWQMKDHAALANLRARCIGFVLQTGGLLPYLSVEANIQLARKIAHLDQGQRWIEELVDSLRLKPLLEKYPHQLSIGERQRASIARAMAHEPVLLLADEPTAALDPELSAQVMELMLGLVARSGSSAVIVSHDHAWLRGRVDRELCAESKADGRGRRGTVFEFRSDEV